ncbi:MAG: hypothetical protein QM723_13960 [Myxococcaceae bacterium]
MDRLNEVTRPLLQQLAAPKPPAQVAFEERLQKAAEATKVQCAAPIEPANDVSLIDPMALVRSMLRQVETEFTLGEQALNKVLEAAKVGKELKPAELLSLQARMQRYDLQSQLMFKLIEQLVGILKALLKTEV